ncbi:MAG TPA: hypothetical protein VN030_00950 [Cellvibrio sp.]|nr:hypothetical protein [Cellvibrio sp.]
MPLSLFNKQLAHGHRLLWPSLAACIILSSPQTLANKDLFASEPAIEQSAPAQEIISVPEETEIIEPEISPTEAAALAQQHVKGKVMNVRAFKEENKTLYGVKLLQKDGRMKTVNVDANNGSIVE